RRNPFEINRLGEEEWDRFQTLSGIQFFFDTEFQVLSGHVYYSNSDWGLSSINQTGLWLERPGLDEPGYNSIMSVDIGDWRVRSREIGKCALECTREELAREVWRQVTAELAASMSDQNIGDLTFPQPKWYSVDKFITFAELEFDGKREQHRGR